MSGHLTPGSSEIPGVALCNQAAPPPAPHFSKPASPSLEAPGNPRPRLTRSLCAPAQLLPLRARFWEEISLLGWVT